MVQPYTIRLAIVAKGLQMTQLPDGRHRAALQIAVYAYAADGQKLGGTRQNIQATMPPKVYEYDLENGMFHNMRVELPVEAASLRLAIFDPGLTTPARSKCRCRCRNRPKPLRRLKRSRAR